MSNKTLNSSTLVIEVENGTNSSGEIQYKKRSYSNINTAATSDALLATANAIKSAISSNTRNILVTESSIISE